MKRFICVLLCLCLCLLCSCAAKGNNDKIVGDILSLCNEEREKLGLGLLVLDEALCQSALIRADEISTDGNFSHLRPDGSGCFTVLTGEYSFAGENLATGENNAEKIVSAWMASPDHKANIIKPEFTKAGIAIVNSGDTYYIVMLYLG